MQKQMTVFELFTDVQKFYSNYLTLDKALMLYEIEHGYKPEIIEDDLTKYPVDQNTVDNINKINGNDYITIENMVYMRDLQESGVCNMIVGNVVNIIQTALLVDFDEARVIHKAYMKYYDELYFPQNLI